MQGNLAPALLRAEPEGAQQAEEDVEQQEAHADAVVAKLVHLSLLVVAADVGEAPYVADIDVADAVLRLAVGLQALDEVAVLVGTDADAQFVVDVYTSPIHAVQFFEIEQEGAAEAGLLEVVVAHGLERRAQAEVHCRVAKEVEAIFAHQRGHPDAVAAEEVIRRQEVAPA